MSNWTFPVRLANTRVPCRALRIALLASAILFTVASERIVAADCNDNRIEDARDIADGTSLDCNVNGVPDECDLASGANADENGNGVPDECDSDCDDDSIPDMLQIARDPTLDCNDNGLLDRCEIAEGLVDDCDESGVPDACEQEPVLSFAGARTHPVFDVNDLLIADLDLDSYPDLVRTRRHDDRIEVHRGTREGTFSADRTLYDVGDAPSDIAARDLNFDGWPDLITSNEESEDLSILLSTGWGKFANKVDHGVGRYARDLIAEDLNFDGRVDIAMISEFPGVVTVLPGRGDGTFGEAVSVDTDPPAGRMIAADLANTSVPMLIVRTQPTETFSESAIILMSMRGSAAPREIGRVPLEIPSGEIAALDFDGDGALDIVATSEEHAPAVLYGRGDGTLRSPQYAEVDGRYQGLAVGDFLGSSAADEFAVGARDDTLIRVFSRAPDGRPVQVQELRVDDERFALTALDLDRDDKDDLVVALWGALVSFAGTSEDTFPSATVTPVQGDPVDGQLADFDLDGVPDLMLWSEGTWTIDVHFLRPDGQPESTVKLPPLWTVESFLLADLDADGLPDIATGHHRPDQLENISIVFNQGNRSFSDPATLAVENQPESLAAADFDGDGNVDLGVLTTSPSGISILFGNGTGSFPRRETSPRPQGDGRTFLTEDLDGDGHVDFVTSGSDPDMDLAVVYLGWGDGKFRSPRSFPVADTPSRASGRLRLVDIDGDGMLDLVSSSYSPEGIYLLRGQGDGSFDKRAFHSIAPSGNSTPFCSDFDGDGDVDIAKLASRHRLSFLMQADDGSFTPGPSYYSARPIAPVGGADVNGDGLVDFVAIDGHDYFFSVLFNTSHFPLVDCDGDGRPDACEIRDGEDGDVNDNGIPDSCEADCDDDGLPDAFEIASGESEDCDKNGVPDGCDLAAGGSDCDQDGKLDPCEIQTGEEPDCDDSGIPDRCEIASGAAEDDNGNGIPDRCEARCLVPGDCSGNQRIDLTDAICVLEALFGGAASAFPCGDGTTATPGNVVLLDWQPDSRVNISDAVGLLVFLFSGGPPHTLAVPGEELSACVRIWDCP